MTPDLLQLPGDLPPPVDDGACDHLTGLRLPAVELAATDGSAVDMAALPGITVLYVYPLTGDPEAPLPDGWDGIPGARGCTPQACAFRDHYTDLATLGARVFGLSVQDTEYQREAEARLHLPYPLLSDHGMVFAGALGLPVFEANGSVFLKRVTLICVDGVITKVFYPVFPPDGNAQQVVDYLADESPSDSGK